MSMSGEEQGSDQPGRHTLCPGPTLPGHRIQQDEEHSTWVIDQTLVPCSQPEYRCLKVLLEQARSCVPFAQLEPSVLEAGSDELGEAHAARVRLRHLISSLRSKVWMVGMDIVSVRAVGYMLLPEATPEEANPHDDKHAS